MGRSAAVEQDMAEDTIRVGIIGAGANTRTRHIPGLKAQEGVEIYGVVNRTRASSEKAAADLDIPNVYEDWQELLEDEEIDAVCIGTWPYMHHPCTIGALEVGKHVLVEARMAMNSDEAREMLAASRDNPHLTTQIVPAPHTLVVDETIIDMISEGYIGDVVNVRAHLAMGSDFPDPDTPLHWRHDRDLSGNNIMGMGIFYEALMRWLGPGVLRAGPWADRGQASSERRRPAYIYFDPGPPGRPVRTPFRRDAELHGDDHSGILAKFRLLGLRHRRHDSPRFPRHHELAQRGHPGYGGKEGRLGPGGDRNRGGEARRLAG